MFDSLSTRLGDVFDRLRRHGALTEDDVGAALREIRVALLEADVALPVVRDFVAAVNSQSIAMQSAMVPKLRPAIMLAGCGHWTEQERAPEVSAAMIDFLRSL